MLSFNLTIVLQMVGFLVFAYLLNLLFFKPIIAHIAARNRYLVEQQATAIQLLKEAQELQSAHEERLQVAQREAQLSLDAAVREAQEQRTKLLAAANLAAHELLEAARNDLQKEREKALVALQAEVGEIAEIIAKKVFVDERAKERAQA